MADAAGSEPNKESPAPRARAGFLLLQDRRDTAGRLMLEKTRQGSKGGDGCPQGDAGADCGPVRSSPCGSCGRHSTTPPGLAQDPWDRKKTKPCLCHERDTAGGHRPIPRPWVAARGRETGQGREELPAHPAVAAGHPSPAGSWKNYLLATDWEGQPAPDPRPTPYFPGGPRSLGHMTGPCQEQASGSPVGPGRPARRHGRKQAVCRPAALGLGAGGLCGPGVMRTPRGTPALRAGPEPAERVSPPCRSFPGGGVGGGAAGATVLLPSPRDSWLLGEGRAKGS